MQTTMDKRIEVEAEVKELTDLELAIIGGGIGETAV